MLILHSIRLLIVHVQSV